MFKFSAIKIPSSPSARRRRIKKNKIALIIGVAVVLSLFVVWFIVALQPVSDETIAAEIKFIINRGDGSREIVANLQTAELIKSTKAFKLYSVLRGAAHQFKPGIYWLSSSWNTAQIVQVLVVGPPETNVVIPEGSTLKDIDAKLNDLGILQAGELVRFDWQPLKADYLFLKSADSLEGFLFPDTYRFAQFSPTELVARTMLNNFSRQVWPKIKDLDNYYGKIIIASLIEKEAPFSSDRKIISGIIYRRMRLGMPLQIDATVAYAKCGQRFFTCSALERRLLKTDLAIDNVFNTYLNKGLPPAPIANFSVDAIEAAINPRETGYLYYLSDPRSRRTIFAATLDEHNTNRAQYLR